MYSLINKTLIYLIYKQNLSKKTFDKTVKFYAININPTHKFNFTK